MSVQQTHEEKRNNRLLKSGDLFFDDLIEGDYFVTDGIMVTESHVVGFAGLSGDRFSIHLDDVTAQQAGFPGRIAHGLLVLGLVDGLMMNSAVKPRIVAALGWDWSFKAPVLINDRVHAEARFKPVRRTKRGDRGIVELVITVFKNQRDVVHSGVKTLMLECRSSG